MSMRTLVNIAVSLVITLGLIFLVRGIAGAIFSVPAPATAQAPAAEPEKKAETAAPQPAEEKKAEAQATPAEEKKAEAPAAQPAEQQQAEAPAAAAGGGNDLVAAGEKVFKKCKACHYVDKEKNKVGPYLKGVVGRKAASVEGFRYSDAMKAKGAENLVWTKENLARYLKAPKAFIPKNKMAFAGLKKDEDIQAVIAYLESMK